LPSLLPTALASFQAHSELIAAHRSNIIWHLTRKLADVGASQKDMQEERVRRQLERARTLGDASSTGPRVGGEPSSLDRSHFQFVPPPITSSSPPPSDSDADEDDDFEFELTESQIQQFESENAEILRAQESLLASVRQAESRLLDISALQTELVVQLQRQTNMVDTLYDEAIASQSEVERGNEQLREAKRRAKSSRKWILLFILFATSALLFLHWYD
jgi:syntaxin 18